MTERTLEYRHLGRAAAGLRISRVTAAALLALALPLRRALLDEVARVDPHAALTWLHTQPTPEPLNSNGQDSA
ncbi:hypothetical protein [Microbacterium plantarum]|uniref:Uncharacterized protein n=1 Tax=Microbacterium plantarum TaxID=1816425 RepID=A0ABV5EST7_9MICO